MDGCIGAAVVNAPGAWHDGHLDEILDLETSLKHLDPKYKMAADSAFKSTPRYVRILRETELNLLSNSERSAAVTAATKLSSLRVAAEWGIGGLTNCFRVLRTMMPSDDPVRRKVQWETCMRLFNVRCRLMHVCQIRNVYKDKD
jgi:hypothetical protein